MTSVLETLDWIVLGIYFLALIAVAAWVVLQKNKNTTTVSLTHNTVAYRIHYFLPVNKKFIFMMSSTRKSLVFMHK